MSFWGQQPQALDSRARQWGNDLKNTGQNLFGQVQGLVSGHSPLDTKRSCTDCIFIPLFLAALAGLYYCINYGVETGNLQRLTHLPDFEGQLCGTNGQGPYIYFCAVSDIQLDLHHQICLESCPADTSTMVACRASGLQQQPSYPTHPFLGMVCMPTSSAFKQAVLDVFSSNPYVSTVVKSVSLAAESELLVVAVVIATIMAFAYLFLISSCAAVLVWACLALAAIVPASIGGYLIYVSQNPQSTWSAHKAGITLSTGDPQNDLIAGIVACALAALFLCVVAASTKTIERAVAAIEEAAECIFQMPLLVIEPWVSFVVRVAAAVPGVVGFLLLNMSGDTASTVDFTSGGPVYNPDKVVMLILVYYLAVFIWIQELLHAISQFVVIFAAEVWYFKSKNAFNSSAYDMLRGWCVAVTYHLGSLIQGSGLITLFRLARIFASFLVKAADETGNPVAECFARIFQCCLACAESLMQHVTSFAYMDIALNGTNYCEGGEQALSVIMRDAGTLAAVEGVTFLFSLAGISAVSAGTTASTWVIIQSQQRYNDPSSPNYVGDPQSLLILVAVISALVAVPFMHLFDTISDTMVYCNGTSKLRMPSLGGETSSFLGNWFGGGNVHTGH
eukprot:TRINITY_DN77534_c0_g1_i1.p1 TRINITY_DN77534_c0_g1~~TRINITY_DN77534_c0_g1_i1.p1  ORF type:complete len:619 (-),score=97.22 TRINITY_DN77534_c0_g1_i1:107-1963(-)